MQGFNRVSDFVNSGPTLNLHLGKWDIAPSYFSAGLIVFLIFLLVLTLAQLRHHLMDWSMKGAFFGIFFGFILAIILEGFLLVGGSTFLVTVFGWKNAPKPVSTALDIGRSKLQNVLGISSISYNVGESIKLTTKIIDIYAALSPNEKEEINRLICK